MNHYNFLKKSLIAGFFLSLFFACNEDPVPQNPDLKTLKLKFEKLVSGRKILRQLKELQKIYNFSSSIIYKVPIFAHNYLILILKSFIMKQLLFFREAKILFFAMFATLFFACNPEKPVNPQPNPDLKTLKLKFEKLVSGRKILRQQEILKQLQNKKIKNFSNFSSSII